MESWMRKLTFSTFHETFKTESKLGHNFDQQFYSFTNFQRIVNDHLRSFDRFDFVAHFCVCV